MFYRFSCRYIPVVEDVLDYIWKLEQYVLTFCILSYYRKQFRADCQLILVPKSTTDSKDYGEIKLASDTYLGIPSQVKR